MAGISATETSATQLQAFSGEGSGLIKGEHCNKPYNQNRYGILFRLR